MRRFFADDPATVHCSNDCSRYESAFAMYSGLSHLRVLPYNPSRMGEGGRRTARDPLVGGDGLSSNGGSAASAPARGAPRITVITVVFNGEETLERTIQSVLGQGYPHIEYIIIDGGSTDQTRHIIQKYAPHLEYWVSEPDQGIYDAWNKGLALSTGDWIAFLGADDVYLDNAVKSYVDAILADSLSPAPEYLSSKVRLKSKNGGIRIIGKTWRWKDFRRYMNVAHVGSLHHRALFDRYGIYDCNYRICGDYELLLRPRQDLRAKFVDFITVEMAVGGVSNNNAQVFVESARAKISAGGRLPWIAQMEKMRALWQWRLRRFLSQYSKRF